MTIEADLFLPVGYRENPPQSADSAGAPYWGDPTENDVRYQVPVYRYAQRRTRQLRAETILDVGSGSGDKLAEFFGALRGVRIVGADQPSGVEIARQRFRDLEWVSGDFESPDFWQELRQISPDIIICADVIEHLEDPIQFLDRLRAISANGRLIMSTPDRGKLGSAPLGPPANPRHVREWTMQELAQLVEANGFRIVTQKSLLPRRYTVSRTEFNRVAWRLLHGQAVPDPRSCQLLELVVAEESPDAGPSRRS